MPRKDPTQVKQRAETAWQEKRPWYGQFYECWEYAAPGMNPFHGGWKEGGGTAKNTSAGQPRYNHLFTSDLIRAARNHANRIVADLFPKGEPWADMHAGPLLGEDAEQMNEVLKQSQNIIYNAIHSSNAQLPLIMMVLDGVISGTGVMKVGLSNDSSTLLDIQAINQGEVAFEPGPGHTIWGFHRKMEMPVEWMKFLWRDAQNLPEQEMDGGKPREYKVHEATYYDPMAAIWYNDVIVDTGEGRGEVRIFEKDYLVSPWIAWRYSLMPGQVQGISPVMEALPTTRTLNKAKQIRLESASIRVAGIYTMLNDSTFNPRTVRMKSGTFLQVGSNSTENPTIPQTCLLYTSPSPRD